MTSSCGLWYTVSTSKRVYFFVQKIGRAAFRPSLSETDLRRKDLERIQEVPNMRVKVTLACSECKQRNYNTMKNKKNDPDRLEMSKYCRFCKKHTTHKETK